MPERRRFAPGAAARRTENLLGTTPTSLRRRSTSSSFAGLERPDDRVLGRVEVLGRVLVLRGVAAADVTALPALAQVHPRVAHLQALFAALRRLGLTSRSCRDANRGSPHHASSSGRSARGTSHSTSSAVAADGQLARCRRCRTASPGLELLAVGDDRAARRRTGSRSARARSVYERSHLRAARRGARHPGAARSSPATPA